MRPMRSENAWSYLPPASGRAPPAAAVSVNWQCGRQLHSQTGQEGEVGSPADETF